MRAVAVHRDAIVVTSRIWRTTATAIRRGDEAVLIDSPYFPDELELLPTLLEQAGFRPSGLLATHADYDHLLGRLAFPGLALGVGQTTAERLRAEPGAAQRELRDADAEHYVARPAPLSLGAFQALPAPGYVGLGDAEIEAHPVEGHTRDGTAFLAPFAGVLVCGDYLSDVEIPLIAAGGSLTDYRDTLTRLGSLLDRAEVVVPGHGTPHDRDTARRLLEEDGAYLDALERGEERPRLPSGRDTARQRQIHAGNLAKHG
ncbi:MAG TPA: MBL fold metallo-hydrolase [Thermoleophilaceae bacterium]|jgi:glyoxylase-like metal-dependent hydrolase (beta-lactamase superfamily II)